MPILTLVVLAPVIAELLAGTFPIWNAPYLLIMAPIYSGGALLIREAVRHRRRGWPSILLLGAAYGFVEEGLASQAIFSPTLYGVAGWGPRLFGVNTEYLEVVIPLHAVWSAALPILLTELLFPSLRAEPWLGRVGMAVTSVVYLFGVAIVAVGDHTQLDPGYWAPPVLLVLSVVAAVVIGVLALWVVPPQASTAERPDPAPSPWLVLGTSGASALAFLGLLIPLGSAEQPAFSHGLSVLVPMAGAAIVATAACWQLRTWARLRGWDDRHRLAVASGALIAHTLVFSLTPDTLAERFSLLGLAVVAAILLGVVALQVRRRHDAMTQTT